MDLIWSSPNREVLLHLVDNVYELLIWIEKLR